MSHKKTKQFIPMFHPVTGERVYSLEEFDYLTSQFIHEQAEILRLNLQKKRLQQNTKIVYV